jgi:hypothetical protein
VVFNIASTIFPIIGKWCIYISNDISGSNIINVDEMVVMAVL